MEQVTWWAHNTAGKLTKIEGHMKEVAQILGCGPASIMEVRKQKMATYDLTNQREKDLKRIQELQEKASRLNVKKGLLSRQLQDEKKKEWKKRAVNQLVEANQTVNQVFKLDTTA
jgi:hypothetical protein